LKTHLRNSQGPKSSQPGDCDFSRMCVSTIAGTFYKLETSSINRNLGNTYINAIVCSSSYNDHVASFFGVVTTTACLGWSRLRSITISLKGQYVSPSQEIAKRLGLLGQQPRLSKSCHPGGRRRILQQQQQRVDGNEQVATTSTTMSKRLQQPPLMVHHHDNV